jgi:hypothetical protein
MQARDNYLGLLRDSDLRLLAEATGRRPEGGDHLRVAPQLLEELLERKEVFDVLFGAPERDPLLLASPFLVFSVLVGRVAADLEHATFFEEWLGPRRSLPVFDAAGLREFLSRRRRRAFLAALLSSYTRVASGTIWERTARGWRRRRFSDLDPVRLGDLLQAANSVQRAVVARRLGDLALFLSGIFPEHVAAHPLQPREVESLRRVLADPGPGEVMRAVAPEKGLWLLEWLGRRAYRLTAELSPSEAPELLDLAGDFGRARRVLNLLTGRYLYPSRERWFPGTSG